MRLSRINRRTNDQFGSLKYECAACKRKTVVPVEGEPRITFVSCNISFFAPCTIRLRCEDIVGRVVPKTYPNCGTQMTFARWANMPGGEDQEVWKRVLLGLLRGFQNHLRAIDRPQARPHSIGPR